MVELGDRRMSGGCVVEEMLDAGTVRMYDGVRPPAEVTDCWREDTHR